MLYYKNNNKIIILLQKIFFSLYFSSFIILLLMNPGIPGRNHFQYEYFKKFKEKANLLQRCDICKILILKTEKSGHCAFCNICVMRYDHHCPWIGKCIGKYNFIIFYLFLIFLSLSLINGILLFFFFLINNHFLFF